jgi:transposase, IS5 family
MKRIYGFSMERGAKKEEADIRGKKKKQDDPPDGETKNKGEVIYDATVYPQDIAYPTDLGLLNKAREITEELIDVLHQKQPQENKPRTYRELARKAYLKVAQNKNHSKKTIRKGIKSQLQYRRRNFKTIEKQLDGFGSFPLEHKLQRKYWIIRTVYLQQLRMFENSTHQVEDRIVASMSPMSVPSYVGKQEPGQSSAPKST